MAMCPESFPEDLDEVTRGNNSHGMIHQEPKEDEEATGEKIAKMKIDEYHDEDNGKGGNHDQKKTISGGGGEFGHQVEKPNSGGKNHGGAGSENDDDGPGDDSPGDGLAGHAKPECGDAKGNERKPVLSHSAIFPSLPNYINSSLSNHSSDDDRRVEKLKSTEKNPESLTKVWYSTLAQTHILVLHLMTLLHPCEISAEDVKKINRSIKEVNPELDFTPGWLSSEIIDTLFRVLQKCSDNKVLIAEYFVSALLINGIQCACPRWKQEDIKNAKWILFPINRSCHWTMLAFDLQFKKRIYLDPYKGIGCPLVLDAENSPELMNLINTISKYVDSYSKLGTETWQCMQPQHAQQKDGHSCGVFICLFARLLMINGDLNVEREIDMERKALLLTILRECGYQ